MKKPPYILYIIIVIGIALMFHHKSGPAGGNAHLGGPFTLTDTHGKTVKNTDFHGRVMLVFMGFTHCPDICPATLSAISDALKSLGSDADSIAPLFITLDPTRDTGPVLAQYLTSFDSRIIGLTGTKPYVDQVVREYHAYYKKQPAKTPNDYLVSHSSYIYVMDKNGVFSALLHADAKPDDIVKALKEALAK